MANPYYAPSANPATDSPGSSADMRTEFAEIEDGFDMLPTETALKQGIVNTQMSDTGAADAYAISLTYVTTLSGADGTAVAFQAANDNTGASTLNVSGLGAKTIVTLAAAALTSGDIKANGVYLCVYDETNDRWVLLNRDNASASETAAAASAVAAAASQVAAAASAAAASASETAAAASAAVAQTNAAAAFLIPLFLQ